MCTNVSVAVKSTGCTFAAHRLRQLHAATWDPGHTGNSSTCHVALVVYTFADEVALQLVYLHVISIVVVVLMNGLLLENDRAV